MSGRKIMSLEAALEEERLEIENLILQQKSRSPPPSAGMRSPSPYNRNPQSPVRSMLDVDAPKSPPPVRSMLDLGGPPKPKSMLEIATDKAGSPGPSSTHTSPTLSYKSPALGSPRHRSASDATKPEYSPRPPHPTNYDKPDSMSAYRFGNILPTAGQSANVKRTGGPTRSSSIGEALRGPDLSNLRLPGDFNQRGGKRQSKSPVGRFPIRSNSPHGSMMSTASGSRHNPSSSMLTLDSGETIDMTNAYRKLSDANLLYGGTSLASLARRRSENDGHGRIEKDNMSPYGELLPDEDSDDYGGMSSDEEAHRGRKLTTEAEARKKAGIAKGDRAAQSLLAAVEDERKEISAQPQYRSLFDEPSITVTGPGNKPAKSKNTVQPSTSFDQDPMSGSHTPLDPDLDADVTAIKLAQNLQLSSTAVISYPEAHRSIRMLYRGEFNQIQQQAEEDHRRLRKYLVATDLSDESTHALEWGIGTVLRDGDTMIAIYCMDEEASGSVDAGSVVPDDPKAMREQAAAVNALARGQMKPTIQRASMSPHLRALERSNTPSPAPSARGKSRLEEERERAVQDITERVSRLLRKTHLQVRVIIEVVHCKNPKHLITEVIDHVNPTLVILGSRGRSALKGTLLGSFSNYLVTKSSVPVMVARKRLRKKSKYQPPPAKQVNNLANPSARSLEMARID